MWYYYLILSAIGYHYRSQIFEYITFMIYNKFVEVHKKYYVVHYPFITSWYKIVIPKNRGADKIYKVFCGESDITERVLPFLGIGQNLHGLPLTVQQLQTLLNLPSEPIKFVYFDDTEKHFENSDTIEL